MRCPSILSIATVLLFPVCAGAQQYIQQQTGAQCAARGGRITQWMSSIEVDPPVGTCFVPADSARANPGSDEASEPDEDDIPDVKLTRPEELSFARKMEQKAREFFSQKNWQKVDYPSSSARGSYERLGDHAAVERMKRLNQAAYCKFWQEQAQAKRAEGKIQWAKNIYVRALNDYCRPSDTDVSAVTAAIEALTAAGARDQSVDRKAAGPAQAPAARPETDSGRAPSASGQAQAPGTASNCISVQRENFRSFRFHNQCPFVVSFRVQTTSINKSREWDSISLQGGSTVSLVSYHEDPTIADPKSPVEAARDEYAFLVQMKAKIDNMPDGPRKEAAKANFVNLLAAFTKKVSGNAR